MFKKTLNFSDLKSDPSLLGEMTDNDVFQIVHRGHEIKVLMTQEHYFALLAKLEKSEGTTKTTPYNPEKLLAEINSKITRMDDLLNKSDKRR